MFGVSKTSKSHRESFSYKAGKATSSRKQKSFKEKSFKEPARRVFAQQQQQKQSASNQSTPTARSQASPPTSPALNSSIITLSIGPSQRLFAAHEDVLCNSPYFAQACRSQFFAANGKRLELPNEEPEVFSSILEFLYKGDYTPKLAYDKKRSSYYLEDAENSPATSPTSNTATSGENTLYHHAFGAIVLKDTVIYCSAHHYALPALQRLALKKQGLQSGVQCSTILASARFAYSQTPATDSKLRAHYLALIIRCRATFKRSGTMQMEMEAGGSALWFDLFVALVNHLDDIAAHRSLRTGE